MQGGEGGGEEVSIEELASNISTYKDQLQQVTFFLFFLFFWVFVSFNWWRCIRIELN